MLFGFDNKSGMATDRVKLPYDIHNVTLIQHGFRGTEPIQRFSLGHSSANESFLQDPLDPDGARRLGHTGEPRMGQGLLIKINATLEVPLKVSIYCVGSDAHSAQAIRPMDLRSFSPIAPEPYFRDFHGGAWWTVTYTPKAQQTGAYSGDENNGLALRLMAIYGVTASAVAFD